jgi:hypothetical protein
MFDPQARCAECGERGTRCHCQACAWCGEIVRTYDAAYHFANGPLAHRDCALRLLIGSVAHLEHRCGCYVPGATERDPAGLTRRQAAEAAALLWDAQHGAGGGEDDED